MIFRTILAITSALCLPVLILHSQPVTDGMGNVGIGTVAPHQSSILETSSTAKGILLPRLNTLQRDAIVRPAHALLIFNTDDSTFQYNYGDEFRPLWYRLVVVDNNGQFRAPLSPGALWYGGADSVATELAPGLPGDVLVIDSTGSRPAWQPMGLLNYWRLGGNTAPSSNIFGTLDATDIDVRTNNINRMRVDGTTGDVSIASSLSLNGASTPLNLNGTSGLAGEILQSGGAGATPEWSSDLNVNSVTVDSLTVNEYANITNNIFTTDSAVFNTNVVFNDTAVFNDYTNINGVEFFVDSTVNFWNQVTINLDSTVVNNVFVSNDTAVFNGPTIFGDTVIFNTLPSLPLSENAMYVGNGANVAVELAPGTADQVLQIDGSGSPTWQTLDLLPTGTVNNSTLVWDNVNGEWIENVNVTLNPTNGNTDINGDLNADGTAVSFPNIPTTTTSTAVVVTDGVGNLQTTDVDDLLGNATLTEDNIWVGDASNNPSELSPGNDGDVLTISGTTPTWTANPGGLLPGGTTLNSTLRWDGTNWVENVNMRSDASGNSINEGTLTVNGALTATAATNVVGDNSANQQLRVDGVVDAVVGNTLVGNPTVWDEVIDGDVVATGLIKAGGSLWIDGVTPNNHRVVANDDLTVGTTNANAIRLSTNGTTAVSIDGTTQQVNVERSVNLNGANVPFLVNGAAGTAGQILLSSGPGVTPNWRTSDELFWGLNGNSGTTPGTGANQNYLGTSDMQDFVVATNSTERFRINRDSGAVLPGIDDTYDLGASNLRWRDVYVGPSSLHLVSNAAETGTPRDWKLGIEESTLGNKRGNFQVSLGTTEAINVTPAGRVGIGSNFGQSGFDVSADLTVLGDVKLFEQSEATAYLQLTDQSSDPYFLRYFRLNEADFRIYHSFNDRIRFQTGKADGTRPGSIRFDVLSTGPAAVPRLLVHPDGVGVNMDGFGQLPGSQLAVRGNLSVGSGNGYFDGAAPANGVIIEGNVGIGTTSPGAKLEVRNGHILLSNGGVAGQIQLAEPNPSGTDYTSFRTQAQSGNIDYILPATIPASLPVNNHVLTITGISGSDATLSWVDNTTNLGQNVWLLGGNTAPGSNILGTLDGTSLDVRTNNTTAITVNGTTQDVSLARNLNVAQNGTVTGNLAVDGNTTLGNNTLADGVTVNAVLTANGRGNTVGDNSANQQLRIDGVVDAAVGNTLAGNPTVWDVVVDGDVIHQGIIKAGGSLWIDGVTPNNHQIVANNALNLGTISGDQLTLSTAGTIAMNVDGVTQQVNVESSLNLAGANTPLLVNGATGTAGQALISGGTGNTPTWGRLNPTSLNLSRNAMFVGNPFDIATELAAVPDRILTTSAGGAPGWRTTLPAGVTVSFDQIATGTNTVATMNVGTGASLQPTGTGVVTANRFVGTGSTSNSVDLATGETAGILPIAKGGTNGSATPLAGGVAYGTGSAYAFTGAGSSGDILLSNGVAAPSFQNPNDLFWRLNGNSGTSPASDFFGTTDAQRIVFRTNNVEQMTLSVTGNLGLGTTVPGSILSIVNNDESDVADDVVLTTFSDSYTPLLRFVRARGTQSSNASALLNNDIAGLIFFQDGTSTTIGATIRAVADANHSATDQSTRLEFLTTDSLTQNTSMVIDDDGKVGIGTATPAATVELHVVGNAGKTVGGTTWVNLSDERVKNVQGDYDKGLSDILKLRPVVFRYKDGNPWGASSSVDQYGYIAQEVEEVFPEAVDTGDDGYLVFNMHPILVAYTTAIQQLNENVEDLKESNVELQEQVEELKSIIENLNK
ncbi:MAG: tail fiber domain-containing protein [Candidatus Kapaibacterium sp.]